MQLLEYYSVKSEARINDILLQDEMEKKNFSFPFFSILHVPLWKSPGVSQQSAWPGHGSPVQCEHSLDSNMHGPPQSCSKHTSSCMYRVWFKYAKHLYEGLLKCMCVLCHFLDDALNLTHCWKSL